MLATFQRLRSFKAPPGAFSLATDSQIGELLHLKKYIMLKKKLRLTGDFRVLDLKKGGGGEKTFGSRGRRKDRSGAPALLPPREKRMPIDQDWPSVWPGPRTFHPDSVPLPVRQGYPARKQDAPPDKYANLELMKIPNFLHLTPLAVQRHCQALKSNNSSILLYLVFYEKFLIVSLEFCTPWPEGLGNEEDSDTHFPIRLSTSDYLHSSPSIRDPLSRIVTLQVCI